MAQKQDKSSPAIDDVVCEQHTEWETHSLWFDGSTALFLRMWTTMEGIFRDFWSRVIWGTCQKVSILDTGEVGQVCPFGKEKQLTVPAWRTGYVGTIAPHHLGSFRRNKSEHQWMLKCMQYIKNHSTWILFHRASVLCSSLWHNKQPSCYSSRSTLISCLAGWLADSCNFLSWLH